MDAWLKKVGMATAITVSLVNFSYSQAKKVDQSVEPPVQFTLKVDGKTFTGEIGKTFKLNGEFKDSSAKISTSNFRNFNYEGVSFHYPVKHHWEADLSDPQSKAWAMIGTESSISLFVISEEYSAEDYAKELIEDFDTETYDEKELKLKLGEQEFEVLRLIFEADEYEYVYDIVSLPQQNGNSRLLLLEDVAPDRNPDSEEAKAVMSLLKKSFKIEK